MALLLLLGAPVDERRTEQVQRRLAGQHRRAGAEILLVEDHLLHKLAPRPPYSFGQEMPTQPAACIFFCQAMRFSSVSRSGETRWSARPRPSDRRSGWPPASRGIRRGRRHVRGVGEIHTVNSLGA